MDYITAREREGVGENGRLDKQMENLSCLFPFCKFHKLVSIKKFLLVNRHKLYNFDITCIPAGNYSGQSFKSVEG